MDGSNDVVFTLSINGTGVVTMTDLRGVHEDAADATRRTTRITLASGLVSVTATVTDNDGDTGERERRSRAAADDQ